MRTGGLEPGVDRAEVYRLAVEHARDLIVVVDAEGRIVYASPSYLTMLGYDPDDLPGRHALSFVHPRDMRRAASAVAGSLAGDPESARFRVRRQDGGWVVIDAVAAPIPATGESPARVLLAGRDVTDLVAAERRLEVAHQVAAGLAGEASAGAAQVTVLEAVCRGLNWDAGAWWAADPRVGMLVCTEVWARPAAVMAARFAEAARSAGLQPGQGPAGRAWAELQPVWLADLESEQPGGIDLPALGVHAAAAFPVMVGSEVLGVLELVQRRVREPDKEVIELVESIGRQLGQFLERRRAEAELRASEALKSAVVETALDCVVLMDEGGLVVDFNPAAEATFGYTRGEILGRPMAELLSPGRARRAEGVRRYLETGEPPLLDRRVETTAVHRDGSRLPVELAITRVDVGGPAVFCAVLRDITHRKKAEARIAHLAYHDPLTELPNRQMLREHVTKAVARADRTDTDVALLFVDLDDFKLINDSLGHAAGDQIMREVAQRLSATVRRTDLVAREGGDDFLVLLSDLPRNGHATSLDRAQRAAASIAEAMDAPFSAGGTELTVSASIGISIYPRDASSVQELLRHADAAMYQAKQLQRGVYAPLPRSQTGAHAELSLISRLRGAVAREELSVLYQPIVELGDEDDGPPRVIGAEALVRWRDGDTTVREPGEFIPFAERVGLIHDIGSYVFGQACDEVRRWADAGTPLAVSVNVSPAELWHPDIPDRLVEAVQTRGIDPELVTIEVTESAVMRDPDAVAGVLARLREFGFGIAIDDFGVGHSSLERLAELPATVLKVDRSFVQRAPTDHVAAALVTTIVDLANRLELEPIAEGIETPQHAEFLARTSCRLGQGFRYGAPMTADEVAELARS
jgi:diguanylate cyclase (GGDEF)-like protein/PAS domain S-box-containing protein